MHEGNVKDRADGIEDASEADRLWFEARPHRQHRVRRHVVGEWPVEPPAPTRPGWCRFTLVRQLRPGARLRLTFAAEGEPAKGEHGASRLFDLLLPSPGPK